jgi:hypothetical protein
MTVAAMKIFLLEQLRLRQILAMRRMGRLKK